ncbi:MAG: CPBP family intramembrane metalloprotease [Deltaproteobacteria bacterium]|nr:CPBP family intramembrane metalloprotease [Deltaproteobacteria bacterium]
MAAGVVISTPFFLGSVAGVLAMEAAASSAGSGAMLDNLALLGGLRVAQAAWILGLAAKTGRLRTAFGLSAGRILPGVIRGLLWCAVFGALALAGILALYLAGADPLAMLRSRLPESAPALALFMVVGTLVAPVAEELFFRGLVYGFFRRWGVAAALVVSTAFFVAPHLAATRAPFTQVVGGAVFALAYERERTLVVPILIHGLGNLALFALTFVSTGG